MKGKRIFFRRREVWWAVGGSVGRRVEWFELVGGVEWQSARASQGSAGNGVGNKQGGLIKNRNEIFFNQVIKRSFNLIIISKINDIRQRRFIKQMFDFCQC